MSQAGIVNVSGGGGGGSPIETITGNDGVATSPTANNIDIVGLTVANATNAVPVYVKHTATSTDSIEVQVAGAAASSAIDNAGLASFNSADFTVDDNGYVSAIYTGTITSVQTSNATPQFVLSGTTETINFGITNLILGTNPPSIDGAVHNVAIGYEVFSALTSATDCVVIGAFSGNKITSGSNNNVIGSNAFINATNASSNNIMGHGSGHNITSGSSNVIIGDAAGLDLTSGNYNTFCGAGTGQGVITGSTNLFLGYDSGSNYTGAESNNILLQSPGVVGESNVTRIGVVQSSCYIAGITDTTPTSGNTPQVVLCDNTGNMTVISSESSGYVLTSNGTATPSFQPSGGGGFGSPTYFQAYLNTVQTVAAGGTNNTIVFNATSANVGSAYNTSTGLFTAPETGFYGFNVILFLDEISATTGKTNNGYVGSVQSGYAVTLGTECFSVTGEICFSYSWSMPMTAGDTVNVNSESDGSGNYQVYGLPLADGGPISKFSGWRIA